MYHTHKVHINCMSSDISFTFKKMPWIQRHENTSRKATTVLFSVDHGESLNFVPSFLIINLTCKNNISNKLPVF